MRLECIVLFTFTMCCQAAYQMTYDADQINELQKIFGIQPFSENERHERLLRFLQQPLTDVQKQKLLNLWKHSNDYRSPFRVKREVEREGPSIISTEFPDTVGNFFKTI